MLFLRLGVKRLDSWEGTNFNVPVRPSCTTFSKTLILIEIPDGRAQNGVLDDFFSSPVPPEKVYLTVQTAPETIYRDG